MDGRNGKNTLYMIINPDFVTRAMNIYVNSSIEYVKAILKTVVDATIMFDD